MTKTRMKTYDRIVQESLVLFNEHGERAITTNHIAAHLGISPGNLYYHFRNKEEIVYQIFLKYKNLILETMTPPSDRSLQATDLADYLNAAFQTMWQYRFMFYDLPGILARNPQMQSDYYQFLNSELTARLMHLFREFSKLGLLSFNDEEEISQLATNLWLITKFWFPFEQTAHPKMVVTEEIGKKGARQILALLRPYILPAYKSLYLEMDALYH